MLAHRGHAEEKREPNRERVMQWKRSREEDGKGRVTS